MSVQFTVVSIGTLSANPFWGESVAVRTPHATTTLVVDEERRILVDPSLPDVVVVSRLFERSGLRPEEITDVFCTTLRPTHRRGIGVFDQARWSCWSEELETYRRHLDDLSGSADRMGEDARQAWQADSELVDRFAAAAEKLTPAVHLFPLPGAAVGSAGLLLAAPTHTVIVAGDAAVTRDHLAAGRAWSGSADVETAGQSLLELMEIADYIVCGHDNVTPSPMRTAV